MQYCSNCGKVISSTDHYCNSCGAQISHLLTQGNTSAATQHDNAKHQISDLYQYFYPVLQKYRNLYHLQNQIARGNEGLSGGQIIAIIAVAIISVLALLQLYFKIFPLLSLLWKISSLLFILFAIVVVVVISNQNQKRKTVVQANTQKNWEALAIELGQHYVNYGSCPLGIEFCNPDILAILQKYIFEGRAYSIKEALNLMISDRQQQAILKEASAAKYYAQKANNNARAAMIFSLWR